MAGPRIEHRLAATVGLAVLLTLGPVGGGAEGATIPVTDCGDSGVPGQLRHAISTAAPGDTIQLPGCTVVLTGSPGDDDNLGGDLDVAGSLTIEGLGPAATILDGGGVDRVLHVLPSATLALADLTVRNGRLAFPPPGGAGILNQGTLTLSRVVVTGNLVGLNGGDGGGIASTEQASLTATDVEVSDNTTGEDGGGISAGGSLVLTRVRVVGNRAPDDGGGIDVLGTGVGSVTITDSTIAGNRALEGQGGGIALRFGQAATITRTTIWGNSAGSNGGGVQVDSNTTLTLTNSTVAHNSSGGVSGDPGGGGLRLDLGADGATLINTTVARNADTSNGPDGAGGISKVDGTLILVNTLVALNAAGPATQHPDLDPAAIDAGGHNLIGGEPRLGPLQDNGGLTLTMAPFPGSPAVDAGDGGAAAAAGLATDQRGAPRSQDGDGNGSAVVDIGAVEVEPAAGGLLAVSPAAGTYLAGSHLDLVLILRAPGREVVAVGASASLDGVDVSQRLASCLVPGVVPDGGRSFRCGALVATPPGGRTGLAAGTHVLEVAVPFADGSAARTRVVWELVTTTP